MEILKMTIMMCAGVIMFTSMWMTMMYYMIDDE